MTGTQLLKEATDSNAISLLSSVENSSLYHIVDFYANPSSTSEVTSNNVHQLDNSTTKASSDSVTLDPDIVNKIYVFYERNYN